MNFTPFLYQTWILKMWQEDMQAGAKWQMTLQNTVTGERKRFETAEALFHFIETVQEQEKYA